MSPRRPAVLDASLASRLGLPLVALALALSASHADADTAGNLLLNPSVEEGTLLAPAAWDSTVARIPTARFAWDDQTAHDGKRSLYVINTSNAVPVWFNWNQTLSGVNELGNKELTLRAWVKTRNLSGKAYILLQAYRDTVLVAALKAGVPRLTMRQHMDIKPADDPQLELGWARKQLSGEHSEWTQLEAKVYVPPTTNMVFVRGGVFGVGEAWFDDFSLTAAPAPVEKAIPLGTNLLQDPGFEDNLDDWEFSLPPVEGLRVEADLEVAHSGVQSLRIESQRGAPFQLLTSVFQVFNTRRLSGKRVRMSGWIKVEDLERSQAYFNVVSTGAYGQYRPIMSKGITGTQPWTYFTSELDIPKDTYTVWARAGFMSAPGRVWFDDLKFEVLGDAASPAAKAGTRRKSAGRTRS